MSAADFAAGFAAAEARLRALAAMIEDAPDAPDNLRQEVATAYQLGAIALADFAAQASALHRPAAPSTEALVAALTPSAETKARHIGEYAFSVEDRDEDGEECTRPVTVPWTTVKDIMAAIRADAEARA